MAHVKVWLACAALAAASGAHAQAQGQGTVWKCVEADGRAHYTNIKKETDGKQCTVVTKEVSVVSPPTPPSRSAASEKAGSGFPKVDRDTQKTRDESRRRILDDELAAEEKGLIDAKAKLAAQEAVRYGDEKNYQRVLDRLKPYQDTVERHERNITALRKELAGLR